MALPPEPILLAAERWLQMIPSAGVGRTRALLSTASHFGDLTQTQYEEAYEWIKKIGLLDLDRKILSNHEILEFALLKDPPVWLDDADLLVRSETELPEDALLAGEALGISAIGTLNCIRRAWGKVNSEARSLVGEQGELEVIRCLGDIPGAQINHVAKYSDSYGYDLSVGIGGSEHHLEIKTTMRQNRPSFYISRNEFNTMKEDPSWSLLMVVLNRDYELRRLYTVDTDWIFSSAPTDSASSSFWETARYDLSMKFCSPGITALRPFVENVDSAVLKGVPLNNDVNKLSFR